MASLLFPRACNPHISLHATVAKGAKQTRYSDFFVFCFDMSYLVRHCVLDELGSRIQQADDSGFSCQVFADLVRGEFISLLWPARAISAGSEVRIDDCFDVMRPSVGF